MCSWWVHPIAAYRDGIIGQPGGGITTDGERAYAVLLASDEELQADDDDAIVYRPRPQRLSRTKLCSIKTPVRVLRGATGVGGGGVFGPDIGVRYEGLYCIDRWSVKLIENIARQHEWHQFTFVLMPAQPEAPMHPSSVPPALHHPDDTEHEDWLEYVRTLPERAVTIEGLIMNGWRGELVWLDSDDVPGGVVLRTERRDSGYASGGAEVRGADQLQRLRP